MLTDLRFIFLMRESPSQAMRALRKGSASRKAAGWTKSTEFVLSQSTEAEQGIKLQFYCFGTLFSDWTGVKINFKCVSSCRTCLQITDVKQLVLNWGRVIFFCNFSASNLEAEQFYSCFAEQMFKLLFRDWLTIQATLYRFQQVF